MPEILLDVHTPRSDQRGIEFLRVVSRHKYYSLFRGDHAVKGVQEPGKGYG